MQKVDGSSPFIRFIEPAGNGGFLVATMAAGSAKVGAGSAPWVADSGERFGAEDAELLEPLVGAVSDAPQHNCTAAMAGVQESTEGLVLTRLGAEDRVVFVEKKSRLPVVD